MKHFKQLFVFALLAFLGFGQMWATDPVTIYSETFGSPSSNTNVSSFSGWSAAGITYSGSAKVGSTSGNVCGLSGSSSSGYVYMSSASIKELIISGINTTGYTNISLSYNYKGGSTSAKFTVAYSTDGTNYTNLSSNNSCKTTWQSKTEATSLPAASNLRIKITNTATNYEYILTT